MLIRLQTINVKKITILEIPRIKEYNKIENWSYHLVSIYNEGGNDGYLFKIFKGQA